MKTFDTTCLSSAAAAAACAPRAWPRSAARAWRWPRWRARAAGHLRQRRLHPQKALQLRRALRRRRLRSRTVSAGRRGADARTGTRSRPIARTEITPPERHLREPAGRQSACRSSTAGPGWSTPTRSRSQAQRHVKHHRQKHPDRHRRPAPRAGVSRPRTRPDLRRDVRLDTFPEAPAGGRRRLHRLRIRLHLQRPGRRGDPAATAAPQMLRGFDDDVRAFRRRRDGQDRRRPAVERRRGRHRANAPTACG